MHNFKIGSLVMNVLTKEVATIIDVKKDKYSSVVSIKVYLNNRDPYWSMPVNWRYI